MYNPHIVIPFLKINETKGMERYMKILYNVTYQGRKRNARGGDLNAQAGH